MSGARQAVGARRSRRRPSRDRHLAASAGRRRRGRSSGSGWPSLGLTQAPPLRARRTRLSSACDLSAGMSQVTQAQTRRRSRCGARLTPREDAGACLRRGSTHRLGARMRESAAPDEQTFRHDACSVRRRRGVPGRHAAVHPRRDRGRRSGDRRARPGEDRTARVRARRPTPPTSSSSTCARSAAIPARLIPAWRQFLDSRMAKPTRRVWGIGEPIWRGPQRGRARRVPPPRVAAQPRLRRCGRRSRCCARTTRCALDAEVIAAAHCSHPTIVDDGARRASHAYCGLDALSRPVRGSAPASRAPRCTSSSSTARR